MKKYIKLLICFILFVSATSVGYAATITSNASGNWNATGTWVGGVVPVAGDIVNIANGHTITVTATAACASIAFASAAADAVIIVNEGITLTVSGDIVMSVPSGNSFQTMQVVGTVSCVNFTMISTGSNNKRNQLLINSGTTTHGSVTISGTLTSPDVNASRNLITLQANTSLSVNAVSYGLAANYTFNASSTVSYTGNSSTFVGDNSAGTVTVAYGNLNMSGTTGRTVTNATITVAGNYTLAGSSFTLSTSTTVPFSVTGNVTVNSGGTLTINNSNCTITGTTTINTGGALTDGVDAGINTFTGLVTVNGTGTWTTTAVTTSTNLIFGGGIAQNNTTASSFAAAAARFNATQNISGAGPISFTGAVLINGAAVNVSNLNTGGVSFTGGATLTGSAAGSTWTNSTNGYLIYSNTTPTDILTTGTLTATATGNTIEYGGTAALNIKGTTYYNLTISNGSKTATATPAALVVSNNLTINSGGTLLGSTISFSVGGNFVDDGTFTRGTSTVTLNGTAAQLISGSAATNFYNLTINSTGGVTLSKATTISNTLTLTNGFLYTSNSNLNLSTTATAISGGSVSAMIITNGTGIVRKNGVAAAYVFPLGDNTGTAEYSPITVTPAASTNITLMVTNAKDPNNSCSSDYLNRYWTITSSAGGTANITCTYTNADVIGTAANVYGAVWNGTTWAKNVSAISANTITFTGVTLGTNYTLSGVDGGAPTLSTVTIASNNAVNTAKAKTGDVVTLSITASETIGTPTVTLVGSSVTPSGSGTSWTATYTYTGAESEAAATFNIAFSDACGNAGTAVTATTNASSVTYDKTVPTFTIQYYSDAALTTSLGNNPKLKTGTYYIQITASEAMASAPTISIAAQGTANDVTNAATTLVAGNVYKYTRTIAADASADGTVLEDISITGTDGANNTSTAANPTNEATKAAYTDTQSPTFTIQYYSDAALTTSLGTNPYLNAGTYYLKITSSENLTAAPTITIAAEGTANDVTNVAMTATVTATSVFRYNRVIAADASAVGSVLEDISITGTDVAGNAVTNTNPTDEATKAAYTDTQQPTITSIEYYSDAGFTTSLGANPSLTPGTYYMKITASELLGATKTITIAANGTSNDVAAAAITYISSSPYIYSYTRVITAEAAIPVALEDISFSCPDQAGNALTSVNPTNEATGAGYVNSSAPTAPTNVAVTAVGGNVLSNILNGTNTNMTATADITAGQATGGSAQLYVGATLIATDASIGAGDTQVSFNLGTASPAALQAIVTAGGVVTVKLINATAGSSTSAVGNPTLTVDYVAPNNQNTVFASNTSTWGGYSVTIVSSGVLSNSVWFAPNGTTSFVAGSTITQATDGTSTTILAPTTAGAYRLYVMDVNGNYSAASTAILTVSTTPTLSNMEVATLAYTEDDVLALTSTLQVDNDDNVTTAVIQITSNYQSSQDVLSYSGSAVSASWNSGTGTLTLSGSDTRTVYQTALRAVYYTNTSQAPNTSTRTVSIYITDASLTSNTVTRNISVTSVNDAPVFTSSATTFATNGAAYTYNITVTDAEGTTPTITAPTKPGWATFTDNGNGTATLTGTATSGTFSVVLQASDGTDITQQTYTLFVGNVRNVPGTYATIQAGINAASSGDRVLIASGTYNENIDFNGKVVEVYGNPSSPGSIIIDGTGTTSVVTFDSGEGNTSVLNGVTITGGIGTLTTISGANHNTQQTYYGGGILCVGSSPHIKNVIITVNTVNTYSDFGGSGGGIFIGNGSAPILEDVTISNNTAPVYRGGGICIDKASATLIDVTVSSNSSGNYGGGIALFHSTASFSNVSISGNTATSDYSYGGGLFMLNSTVTCSSVSATSNSATGKGSGVYKNTLSTLGTVTLTGNTQVSE